MKDIWPSGLWNIKFFQLDAYWNKRLWEEKAFNVASKVSLSQQASEPKATIGNSLPNSALPPSQSEGRPLTSIVLILTSPKFLSVT